MGNTDGLWEPQDSMNCGYGQHLHMTHLQADAHFFLFLFVVVVVVFSSLFFLPWVFDIIFPFICSKECHRMENVFLFGLYLEEGTSLSW